MAGDACRTARGPVLRYLNGLRTDFAGIRYAPDDIVFTLQKPGHLARA